MLRQRAIGGFKSGELKVLVVTDIAAGYDHIAGAIGGALAATYGADFLCYVTPAERHDGRDSEILRRRHALYLQARARNPRRWSGDTRNWSRIERDVPYDIEHRVVWPDGTVRWAQERGDVMRAADGKPQRLRWREADAAEVTLDFPTES